MKVKLLCRVRLSDPMDRGLPGSSIHGIFQARVLEWGAIALSSSRAYLKLIFYKVVELIFESQSIYLQSP